MKNYSEHLEFEKLVGRAEGGQIFDVLEEAHLTACADCAGRLRRLEIFFAVAKPAPVAVPQLVTANLLNIFQKPKTEGNTPLLKRLFGSLIFDDWRPEFAVRERLSSLETRQLLYRADRYEIDLRLTFDNGKCRASGQIFPDCANGIITLFSETVRAQAALNRHCEFILPPLEEGVYRLKAEISGEIIEIRDLALFL